MQRIETGTTGERQVRCLIFVVMCAAFAGYFAYDGWIGYPKKNLEEAKKNLPDAVPEESIKTNPNVTVANVNSLREAFSKGQVLTEKEVKERLGAPCWVQDTPQELYYIGPAVFCKVKLAGSRVLSMSDEQEIVINKDRSEWSIFGQKVWGGGVGVVAVIAILQLIRIVRTRVVLDDDGLAYNGKLIRWDDMTALNGERYYEKGWVDLEHAAGGTKDSLRIDNYKVKAFKEIVAAICERKGFTSPFRQEAGS